MLILSNSSILPLKNTWSYNGHRNQNTPIFSVSVGELNSAARCYQGGHGEKCPWVPQMRVGDHGERGPWVPQMRAVRALLFHAQREAPRLAFWDEIFHPPLPSQKKENREVFLVPFGRQATLQPCYWPPGQSPKLIWCRGKARRGTLSLCGINQVRGADRGQSIAYTGRQMYLIYQFLMHTVLNKLHIH